MDNDEWRDVIQMAQTVNYLPSSPEAVTFLKQWDTFSRPCALALKDGTQYVVKMSQTGRSFMRGVLFVEHLVGRLAMTLEAAVPPVALINVSQDLIRMNPDMEEMVPGLGHGSLHLPQVSDREAFCHTSIPENRRRFALLSVLYGWIGLNRDHQFLYSNTRPEIVHSVDHGFALGQDHFIEHSPWNAKKIYECIPPDPDGKICKNCCLTQHEINNAIDQLQLVTDSSIANAVSFPPYEWNVSLNDRVIVAAELSGRRNALLDMLR